MSVKVKLETYQNGPYIKAPSFCPFASTEFGNLYEDQVIKIVNPSLCPLCKKCDFYVDEISQDGITKQEKEKIIKYLTEFNTKIAQMISGQHLYLSKESRLPLTVLISLPLLEQCLQYACDNNKKRIDQIKNFVFLHESPICYIMGCPVIFSSKLTKSQVQVVGEIQWK